MKRFLKVVFRSWCIESFTESDVGEGFDDRCSCAVACGYVPCGNMLQVPLNFETTSNENDVLSYIGTEQTILLVQCFYDPEGKATIICGHCAKCESCEIAPEEDAYCSQFEDVCYKEMV